MPAGHGVYYVTIGVRTEDVLHAVARAKGKITLAVKPSEPAAQDAARPWMAIVALHYRKPVQKQARQRQAVPFRCPHGQFAEMIVGQCQDHVRLKSPNRFIQRSVGQMRPYHVLEVRQPRSHVRSKSRLSQPMQDVREPELQIGRLYASASALVATISSNGSRSIKCRYMTTRTPQSLRGGAIETNSTFVFPLADIRLGCPADSVMLGV